jgi:uncharacterized protein YqkB
LLNNNIFKYLAKKYNSLFWDQLKTKINKKTNIIEIKKNKIILKTNLYEKKPLKKPKKLKRKRKP